jgi:hypothetical protein
MVRVNQQPGNQLFRLHLTQLEAGLEIFTFFTSVLCISNRPDDYRKGRTFYVVFGGILLALTTIEIALDALWGQYMWIDDRNYPGGPLEYFVETGDAWYNVVGLAAGALVNILGDGLLVCPIFPRGASQNRKGRKCV